MDQSRDVRVGSFVLGSRQGADHADTATVGAASASSHAGVQPCKEANPMTTKLGPPVRIFQTSGKDSQTTEKGTNGVRSDEQWVSAGAGR